MHLAIAWPGLFALMCVLAASLPRPLSSALINATFLGPIALGAVAGWLMQKRIPAPEAALVFVLPLLAFLWDARVIYLSPSPYGGWGGVWTTMLSNNCGAGECLEEALVTMPLFTTAAYAAASILRRSLAPTASVGG